MVERYDPGTEPDRPDFRYLRPALPCEVSVLDRDGWPVWCPGHLEHWQRRTWGQTVGPDGWWGYGAWYLPDGTRGGGWAHESELRRRDG